MATTQAARAVVLTLSLVAVAAMPANAQSSMHLDRSVLNDPTRPATDREQDASRHALELYEWLGIRPGMVVADIFTAQGYNTHLLSRLMGANGQVFAVLGFFVGLPQIGTETLISEILADRVREARLANVTTVEQLDEMPSAAIDVMVCVRNYHDVEWVFPEYRRKDTVAQLYRALKPGGVIGVVEVATYRPGWDEPVHRLNQETVIADFLAGGFALVATTDLLRNPADDYSIAGFGPPVVADGPGRHTMDRYVLKFQKPAR